MSRPSELQTPKAGAGVLELLRQFAADPAAASAYGEDCLKRTQRIEPQLKAFEYLPRDVTAKTGPLGGIPVAIKDIIATSDMPTTNGSAIYRDHVPAADAWVVARLRDLGATIFGKTVSTEFAWRHPGPTVNPWNPAHTPGGSSSGSAAAVAAGLVPLALGTQTLGSVIRPAAFNGVVGFKPSFGAIPRTGVHPLSPSLDHIGFFARRVDDVALALSLLAGVSADDVHGRPLPAFTLDVAHGLAPLAKPRLAVVRFAKWERAEAEQKAAFEATIDKLRAAGAVVDDAELKELDAANWDAINTIMLSEATTIFSDLIARYPDRVSDVMKTHVESGRAKTAMDYLAAKAAQSARQKALAAELDGYDAVLTLPAFGEAPRGLHWTGDAEYCAPWTFVRAPAVALPAGFGKNGLPLGVQVTGSYRNDLQVLRVAKWVETALGFDPGLPPIAQQAP
ncbi:putative amidase (amiD) [Bradyrhizobium sp. ORS 375]|uniref:amidase n=1 Tax=Bradyrhizobium sp. (strain ORS 375) TaxID=566679 RepID=UPI000240ACA4|nr:amidase [Bradyrhizobium sp. ORS 375]CCD90572.1 putative amidase (amiD) [Bradyrhizobium sp. ORS 375]